MGWRYTLEHMTSEVPLKYRRRTHLRVHIDRGARGELVETRDCLHARGLGWDWETIVFSIGVAGRPLALECCRR